MTTVGTATITFSGSAAEGGNYTETVVTGGSLSGISNTGGPGGRPHAIEAFIPAKATADFNEYEHAIAPIRLSCGNIVNGTSFTIYAISDFRLDGSFNVIWVGEF